MIKREVLEDIGISEIALNPRNPRINDETVMLVAKSIERSEYISPIVVDEKNMILAGNTRYKAMKQLGWSEIPLVLRIEGLTDEQKSEYILADNKTQEFSEWDYDKLADFTRDMLLR